MNGPSNTYLRMLRGRITPERYAAIVRRHFRIELAAARRRNAMDDRNWQQTLKANAELASEIRRLRESEPRRDETWTRCTQECEEDAHEGPFFIQIGTDLWWSYYAGGADSDTLMGMGFRCEAQSHPHRSVDGIT